MWRKATEGELNYDMCHQLQKPGHMIKRVTKHQAHENANQERPAESQNCGTKPILSFQCQKLPPIPKFFSLASELNFIVSAASPSGFQHSQRMQKTVSSSHKWLLGFKLARLRNLVFCFCFCLDSLSSYKGGQTKRARNE